MQRSAFWLAMSAKGGHVSQNSWWNTTWDWWSYARNPRSWKTSSWNWWKHRGDPREFPVDQGTQGTIPYPQGGHPACGVRRCRAYGTDLHETSAFPLGRCRRERRSSRYHHRYALSHSSRRSAAVLWNGPPVRTTRDHPDLHGNRQWREKGRIARLLIREANLTCKVPSSTLERERTLRDARLPDRQPCRSGSNASPARPSGLLGLRRRCIPLRSLLPTRILLDFLVLSRLQATSHRRRVLPTQADGPLEPKHAPGSQPDAPLPWAPRSSPSSRSHRLLRRAPSPSLYPGLYHNAKGAPPPP